MPITQAVAPADIAKIHDIIREHIRLTPVLRSSGRDLGLGSFPLTWKLELMQHAGSFKARGAFANLLMRHVPTAGVVAASGGNHGIAVAYAAMTLGFPATIFVPTVSSPAKIARIKEYGAMLSIVGDRYDAALTASREWAAKRQALVVHAFDQVETMLGQGTLGKELSEQVPDADTIIVAVGGGGLIGGIAAWYSGRVRIVAVEPAAAPTLSEALKAGRPVDAPAGGVAADSLAPRRVGELTFPLAQQYVDRVVLVEDEDILRAQQTLWTTYRVMAEPGGAAGLAALLSGRYTPAADEHVAVIVCGGNTAATPP